MKITLEIPDGMRCAYLLHDGAEIKLPREAKPDEK